MKKKIRFALFHQIQSLPFPLLSSSKFMRQSDAEFTQPKEEFDLDEFGDIGELAW